MGQTRNFFKKVGDVKGTFDAKMDTIKERNGKDLTEAEEIKSGKNTQKNYTKTFLMIQITLTVWSLT